MLVLVHKILMGGKYSFWMAETENGEVGVIAPLQSVSSLIACLPGHSVRDLNC